MFLQIEDKQNLRYSLLELYFSHILGCSRRYMACFLVRPNISKSCYYSHTIMRGKNHIDCRCRLCIYLKMFSHRGGMIHSLVWHMLVELYWFSKQDPKELYKKFRMYRHHSGTVHRMFLKYWCAYQDLWKRYLLADCCCRILEKGRLGMFMFRKSVKLFLMDIAPDHLPIQ